MRRARRDGSGIVQCLFTEESVMGEYSICSELFIMNVLEVMTPRQGRESSTDSLFIMNQESEN